MLLNGGTVFLNDEEYYRYLEERMHGWWEMSGIKFVAAYDPQANKTHVVHKRNTQLYLWPVKVGALCGYERWTDDWQFLPGARVFDYDPEIGCDICYGALVMELM
jgi:hypothetical protein